MKSILVIDDEFDLTSTLKAILESRGYRVAAGSDGREARELIERDQPDLLLLDVMIPLESGYDLLDWIRGSEHLQNIPVVLMNHVDPPPTRPVAWQGYLKKPITLNALYHTIESIVGLPEK